MKLRNKKTGDIWDFDGGFAMKASHETAERAGAVSGVLTCYADSLAELNEEWEDVEPLIKDEKIRKVVRAWADGNMATRVQYDAFWRGFRNRDSTITVWEELPLEDNKVYTIAELCGEEEE